MNMYEIWACNSPVCLRSGRSLEAGQSAGRACGSEYHARLAVLNLKIARPAMPDPSSGWKNTGLAVVIGGAAALGGAQAR